MMFRKGQQVKVYPHGSPDQAAIGVVVLCGKEQLSILIMFDAVPPFSITRNAGLMLTDLGIPFFGKRVRLEGKAWGPWVEMFDGGHYEIEEV